MNQLEQLQFELEKYAKALEYYETTGNRLANTLISAAIKSYESGEIDFFQYIQSMDRGVQINVRYLENLQGYNETALSINYL